jgi:esterase/lipase
MSSTTKKTIKSIKAQLPKRGAYPLIIKENKKELTYSMVANFFNGKSVSADKKLLILKASQKAIKKHKELEELIAGMI